mgnify:CR=1 FL=1
MKVGIFDSGLGGLTVVSEIKKKYPKSSIIYLGDTARVPYGTRSKEVIEEFAVQDAKFLESKKVDLIIIACNTVSAVAVDTVKKAVSVPVYEVITAAKNAAVKATKNGKIGVIATRATINSGAYGVQGLACPLLVPLIEEGEISGPIIDAALDKYLDEVKTWGIDTLILGCTHYPLVSDLIAQKLPGVTLISSGAELAKTLNISENEDFEDEYYATDLTDRFKTMAGDVKINLAHL